MLLDTILGTLFILCFLTYTNEGQLFKFLDDIGQEEGEADFIYGRLNDKKLPVQKLSYIANRRRILRRKKKKGLSDCGKCLGNTVCCPVLVLVNIVFTLCVLCRCTKEKW